MELVIVFALFAGALLIYLVRGEVHDTRDDNERIKQHERRMRK